MTNTFCDHCIKDKTVTTNPSAVVESVNDEKYQERIELISKSFHYATFRTIRHFSAHIKYFNFLSYLGMYRIIHFAIRPEPEPDSTKVASQS